MEWRKVDSIFNLAMGALPEKWRLRLTEGFRSRSVTVTGGASFIGSHLVDCLLEFGATVQVVDDFSSGRRDHLPVHPRLTVVEGDLRSLEFAREVLRTCEVVFHLAAIHGGRGFIETQQRSILANLAIDNNVFSSAVDYGVERIVHASSACAYPIDLQSRDDVLLLLSEDQASMDTPSASFPDGVYGWAKLMGEYQLQTQVQGTSTRGRSARIFTAYGERENESHAAVALIAKALLKMDPFPIWGTGKQTRNFTYVADTVCGLLLLSIDPSPESFDVFNIGTSDHVRVLDFVDQVFTRCQWTPGELDLQLERPVGVASRASNNAKMLESFGWCPSVQVATGIDRTVNWYEKRQDRPKSARELELMLMVR